MRYRTTKARQAAQMINVTCCLLFVFFCFVYLFLFQGDVMSMAQHVLSHGRTAYHTLLYSSLITIALALVGSALVYYIHVPIRYRALLWMPCFGILGFLSDFNLPSVIRESHGNDIWAFLLLIVVFFVSLFLVKSLKEKLNDTSTFVSFLWPNLFILAIGMSFTCLVGNTDKTLHYELRMERLLVDEKYDDVLRICADDPHPSRCVMYTRAYALSCLGEMGERLFTYNNNLGSDALLPAPADSLRPANIPKRLRETLGGFPYKDMNATRFLQHFASDTLATDRVHDYLLCGLLLDKDLPTFADSLISYYSNRDSIMQMRHELEVENNKRRFPRKLTFDPVIISKLPRHYAEALLLYSRITTNPIAVLDDDETLQNYLDFTEQQKTAKTPAEQEALCRSYYNNTYWCYYYFSKAE